MSALTGALFALLCFQCVSPTYGAGARGRVSVEATNAFNASDPEKSIIRFTNEERRKKGLPPLRYSPALKYLARTHTLNMCRVGKLKDKSGSFPKGWRTFNGRLDKVGLQAGGENIGYMSELPNKERWAREMVHQWMSSRSHRDNMLNPEFRYLGVGVRKCGKRTSWATLVVSPEPGSRRGD
jgi:uncharacterized protein YkwD